MKTLFICFILTAFFCFSALSQLPFRWYSANEDFYGIGLVETNDGGFMIAAHTNNDVWLIKTNSDGDSLWAKTLPLNSIHINAIIGTPDMGFALAGSIGSIAGIIKTDSMGNIEWTNTATFPSNTIGEFRDLVYTSSHKYVAVGDGDSACSNCRVPIISEFDSAGNYLPVNFYFNYFFLEFWKMNNLIETDFGTVLTDGIALTPVNGAFNTILHEFDINSGAEVNNVNATFGARCDCRLGKNKKNYVTGFGPDQPPVAASLLITPWYSTMMDYSYDYSSLTSDTIGNSYLAGGGITSDDLVIFKFNSSGDSAWKKTYGGSAKDEGKQIILSTDNRLVVAGTTESPGNGYKNVLLLISDTSGSVVSVNEFNLPDNSISIYPDPAYNKITISKVNDNKIYLRNSMGQLIRIINTENYQQEKLEIDVSDLKSGVYFVEIGQKAGRFVKIAR